MYRLFVGVRGRKIYFAKRRRSVDAKLRKRLTRTLLATPEHTRIDGNVKLPARLVLPVSL